MSTELDLDDCAAQSDKAMQELVELREERRRLLFLAGKYCTASTMQDADWYELLEIAAGDYRRRNTST